MICVAAHCPLAVPVAVAYRVSHRGLQRRILLLLAADVIKSE